MYHYDKKLNEVTSSIREVGKSRVTKTRNEVAQVQPYNDYDFYFEDDYNN